MPIIALEALCEVLGCQPGDLLRWEPGDADDLTPTAVDGEQKPVSRDN